MVWMKSEFGHLLPKDAVEEIMNRRPTNQELERLDLGYTEQEISQRQTRRKVIREVVNPAIPKNEVRDLLIDIAVSLRSLLEK